MKTTKTRVFKRQSMTTELLSEVRLECIAAFLGRRCVGHIMLSRPKMLGHCVLAGRSRTFHSIERALISVGLGDGQSHESGWLTQHWPVLGASPLSWWLAQRPEIWWRVTRLTKSCFFTELL
jgi:hypothetical protein